MQRHWQLRSAMSVALGLTLALLLSASAGAASIPQRSDIEEKDKWNTATIYSDLNKWEADYSAVKQALAGLNKYRGNLGQSADMLLGSLKLNDSLNVVLSNLYV